MKRWSCLSVACGWLVLGCSTGAAQDAPDTPRIDSLVILDRQPAETDPAVIWYDNFDDADEQSPYAEKSGDVVDQQHFGAFGKSLRMHYPKGSRGIGGRKVFFG